MALCRALRSGRLKRTADVRIAPGDARGFSARSFESRPARKRATVARDTPGASGGKQTETLDVKRLAKSYAFKISSYAKQASWRDACWVLSDMPQVKVKPDVIIYNTTISACGKGGQWQQALAVFGAMPQAKVKPDVISYSAAISACEKGGQWQQALGMFGAMPQAKVKPNVISYSAAIGACEKGGQWQQALGLFGAMPQAKVQPTLASYNAVLDAIFDKSQGPPCFDCGISATVFPTLMNATPRIIDLHELSEGAAQLAVRWWLATLVAPSIGKGLGASEAYECIIITGYGRSRKGWGTSDVQAAVLNMLRTLKLSAGVLEINAGRLQLVLRKCNMPLLQQCVKQQARRRKGDVRRPRLFLS
ncbi:unnamed protein product [Effrenium voratum]|nr:unnamed protein product [Effrenium voratum]